MSWFEYLLLSMFVLKHLYDIHENCHSVLNENQIENKIWKIENEISKEEKIKKT